MLRRQWFLGTLFLVAMIAVNGVLLTPDPAQGTACTHSCTGNNNVCTGAATGSCVYCYFPGVSKCSNPAGRTSYSGNATYGSNQSGNSEISTTTVVCTLIEPCLVGDTITASHCTVGIDGQASCYPVDDDSCSKCAMGSAITKGNYQSCQDNNCS